MARLEDGADDGGQATIEELRGRSTRSLAPDRSTGDSAKLKPLSKLLRTLPPKSVIPVNGSIRDPGNVQF
jgi:hypothetical protein